MKQWMVARRKLLVGGAVLVLATLTIGGAGFAASSHGKRSASADCQNACPKGTPCEPCPDCPLPSCPKRCD